MTRLIAALSLACLLWGCEFDEPAYEPGTAVVVPVRGDRDAVLAVYVIDSCEYLGSSFLASERSVLTHKGNCRFCAARDTSAR